MSIRGVDTLAVTKAGDTSLTETDEKVLRLMGDRVVLKPLTRWNDAYKEFPRYVL